MSEHICEKIVKYEKLKYLKQEYTALSRKDPRKGFWSNHHVFLPRRVYLQR